MLKISLFNFGGGIFLCLQFNSIIIPFPSYCVCMSNHPKRGFKTTFITYYFCQNPHVTQLSSSSYPVRLQVVSGAGIISKASFSHLSITQQKVQIVDASWPFLSVWFSLAWCFQNKWMFYMVLTLPAASALGETVSKSSSK